MTRAWPALRGADVLQRSWGPPDAAEADSGHGTEVAALLVGRGAGYAGLLPMARLRAAGAALTGHTNLSEFAYSGLGLNPGFGTPANPRLGGRARAPGGSSSGAALAVLRIPEQEVVGARHLEEVEVGRLQQSNARGASPDIFIQINTGEEPQKAGILPGQADDFISACRAMYLPVVGLMCIPPDGQPPGPYFAHLAELGREAGVANLSMGMSGDFETGEESGHPTLLSVRVSQRDS